MIEAREVERGGLLPSERDLMRRFGVGRPAVREALQALERMGLIEIRHGGRARLLPMDARRILERLDLSVRHLLLSNPENQGYLREARLMFEAAMVRIAAAKATAADLERLHRALSQQESARGDAARFIQCDIAFHVAIAEIAGNPVFTAVAQSLLQWLFEFRPRLLRAPNTEQLTLKEHRDILEAIQAHDPEGAAFALRAHLLRTHPLYARRSELLERRSPAPPPGVSAETEASESEIAPRAPAGRRRPLAPPPGPLAAGLARVES